MTIDILSPWSFQFSKRRPVGCLLYANMGSLGLRRGDIFVFGLCRWTFWWGCQRRAERPARGLEGFHPEGPFARVPFFFFSQGGGGF